MRKQNEAVPTSGAARWVKLPLPVLLAASFGQVSNLSAFCFFITGGTRQGHVYHRTDKPDHPSPPLPPCSPQRTGTSPEVEGERRELRLAPARRAVSPAATRGQQRLSLPAAPAGARFCDSVCGTGTAVINPTCDTRVCPSSLCVWGGLFSGQAPWDCHHGLTAPYP